MFELGSLTGGGLIFVRALGFLSTFPLFRHWLRQPVLFVMAVATAFNASAASGSGCSTAKLSVPILCGLVLAEAMLGVLLAAPIAILFEALPSAGRLVDCLRGALYAEQILPGLEQRTAPLESFSLLISLFILFPLRGYTAVIAPLLQSFQSPGLEPGLGFSGFAFAEAGPAAALRIAATALDAMRSALLLAGPAFIVLVVMELVILVLCRIVPKLNVSTELAPVKLVVGLILFLLLFGDPVRDPLTLAAIPRAPLRLLGR